MNFNEIPIIAKMLSSLSASFVLWSCLSGLEVKSAYDLRQSENPDFDFWSIINFQVNSLLDIHTWSVSFDNKFFSLLLNNTYFLVVIAMLFLAFLSTFILVYFINCKITRAVNVGEARKVNVFKFRHHDNEFILKCSGLITIITVLYTASSGFAMLSTILLSIYSPIWSYNSLIQIQGVIFTKAFVQLDNDLDSVEECLVLTTRKVVDSFVYKTDEPSKMNIILYNKISIIR
ncbi:TPA: hypothetical protein NKP42_004365 [Vibrio parahaemolyticus]|nr:hypothetical protein [Vibrio parahaemolyticus]